MNRRFFMKSLTAAILTISSTRFKLALGQSASQTTPLSINLTGAGRVSFYIDYSELTTAGRHTFYVCRTHGTSGDISVNYQTAGDGHTSANGTLRWASGEADIKSFTVDISAANLTTHDNNGLGEHRIVATLSNPSGGAELHHGSLTRAYGVIDNDSMIASNTNAYFIDFDASSNGNGRRESPFNNWYSARNIWGGAKKRYIYGKGSATPDGTDNKGGIKVFDEEGANGKLTASSDSNRLFIRNWPGETWTITRSGRNDIAGFYIESGGDYTTFKGITFNDLSTTGVSTNPMQCFAVWLRRRCVNPTIENCTISNITSGAVSGTGAIYVDGGPVGLKVWNCDVFNIKKSNDSLPNGFEIYDGGSVSIQKCTFKGCSIYQKDSPDPGEIGISVRFCIVNEMIRLSGLGKNPNGSYHIIQGNLLSQTGIYAKPAIRLDGRGAMGEKHWIVGNIFNRCGGSNLAPILSEHSMHTDHIIFNNIFYGGQGIWRLSSGGTTDHFEFSDYNHDYNVASTGGWKYHYKGSQYSDTASMTNAKGWEAHMSTGDPLLRDLADNDCRLLPGSPCLNTGVGGSDKGIYLTGAEPLGAGSYSQPAPSPSPIKKMPPPQVTIEVS